MYFTKVELHNFGIYKGTHEMCLTDQIGNRNITLVGGLNGRGKTTFHDSILIALYGKQALKYIQEKARSYDKLLLDHAISNTISTLILGGADLQLRPFDEVHRCRAEWHDYMTIFKAFRFVNRNTLNSSFFLILGWGSAIDRYLRNDTVMKMFL